MDNSAIASAAAELERAIEAARRELQQLIDARSALDPFVGAAMVSSGPSDPSAIARSGTGPVGGIEPADRMARLAERGPSFWIEEVLRAHPDREMSFDEIEAELAKLGVTYADRDKVRGGVYYGKRKGWAVRSSRGTWRYKDTSASAVTEAEGVESTADSLPE